MTLFVWLIASFVFSCIGAGGLLLLRRFVRRPLLMRSLIWLVVWLSLLLPVFFVPFRNHPHPAGIHTASSVGEFCHCQKPDAGDKILYQANLGYDFVLHHHNAVSLAWIVPGLFMFCIFSIRAAKTMRRFRRSPAETLLAAGTRVRLLRDLKDLPVGAVGLFRNYIHWHSALDALPAQFREAILVHERTHLRQFHTAEKIAIAFVNAIWWMNPSWHILRRELAIQAEFAADEAAIRVMGDRKLYASLLLQLQSSRQPGLLFTFSKTSTLSRRIRHLLRQQQSGWWKPVMAALLFTSILTTGDAVAGTFIQHQWEKVEVYKVVNRTHQVTGKTEFCKSCAIDNAAADCYEAE